jgi:LmbE family N-acetylglucosaminyl deacetylase
MLKQLLKKQVVFTRQSLLRVFARMSVNRFAAPSACLIIAPHPDDEVLGCGGMIADLTALGKRTDVLFITEGAASHNGCCSVVESEVGKQRRYLAFQANAILGIPKENLTFLDGKDGKLPRKGQADFNAMAQNIARIIKDKVPDAIFCPHPLEGWSDHIAASELAGVAIALLPREKRPRLYYYCVWFWYSLPLTKALRIDWRKARLLNIQGQYSVKEKAINAYISALAPCGNPWVGKLPKEFLRAFDWQKELFFEA